MGKSKFEETYKCTNQDLFVLENNSKSELIMSCEDDGVYIKGHVGGGSCSFFTSQAVGLRGSVLQVRVDLESEVTHQPAE